MKEYEFHEIANIFPLMDNNEFEELKEDIQKNGYRKDEPVILFEDKILDGRNRYNACKELQIEANFTIFKNGKPLIFVISKNLHRRHLNSAQKCEVGFKLEDYISQQAKEAQIRKPKYETKKEIVLGSEPKTKVKPIHTRKEIAKTMKISTKTYDQAKKIQKIAKEDTEKQTNGIDGKTNFKFQYDPKVNSYFAEPYRKILLENRHEGININYYGQEEGKNGWLWYSKSDVIFFLWWAKNFKLEFFCDGYYLFLNNIRKWFDPSKYEEHKNKYPSYNKLNGSKWWTYNYLIPIEDFPEDCILKMNKTIFKTKLEESYFNKWFKFENGNSMNNRIIKKERGLDKWLQ